MSHSDKRGNAGRSRWGSGQQDTSAAWAVTKWTLGAATRALMPLPVFRSLASCTSAAICLWQKTSQVKRSKRGNKAIPNLSRRAGKYHGHHGDQPSAGQAERAHDDLHAGAGTLQRGGLGVRVSCERKRPHRRLAGVLAAERDDRRGRGHRRGRQRPAVQESGRKEPAPCQRYGRERHLSFTVQLCGVSGHRPYLHEALFLCADQ